MEPLSAPIRIWYQSFIHPEQQAPYFQILKESLARLADPGVQFDLGGVSPPDLELNRITEFRCAVQAVKNAVTAQDQGYDAVAIGHFQDGGLYEARAAVDIPVLGLGERITAVKAVTTDPGELVRAFTDGEACARAVLAKAAEMAVKLHRLNGMGASRALTFAKPSEKALREFLES